MQAENTRKSAPCRDKRTHHTGRMSSNTNHESKNIAGRKIGYVRVSDADQSEALQMDSLNSVGCEVIYRDHGVSGEKTARPRLDQMMKDLKAGDTLTVWKLDRLGRSTIHLLSILEDLRERGIHFHAITQGIDTSTAVGRMIFGQLAVFAEYERNLISERTKAGMKAAKARGVHVGRPRMSKAMRTAIDGISKTQSEFSISEADLERRRDDAIHLPPRTSSKDIHKFCDQSTKLQKD